MSDTKQIVGTLTGITEKPTGFFDIEVQVEGNKYPTRLSTKLAELIEKARETKGALATWEFREVEGKENPNTGKPYMNRYLDGVELGDKRPAPPEAHHSAMHFADKDRAISRMACIRSAAMLDYRDAIDVPLEIMRTAGRFERWIYRDIDPVPFSPKPEPQPDGPLADAVTEELARAEQQQKHSEAAVPEEDLETVPF